MLPPASGKPLWVQKTSKRTVRSLRLSLFHATETIRYEIRDGAQHVYHSPDLDAVVPRGQHYAFDLIAHVGVQHFLRGRKLLDVWEDLCDPKSNKRIPFNSLFELSRKFLYYLGELHRQSGPAIKGFFQVQGSNDWLVDGTLEPGTPVYFGVKEAKSGILLQCRKIPSENVGDISGTMKEAAQLFGVPQRIRHDLSENISTACEETFPGVPHDVCQYHLLSDIGEDLYQGPQNALGKRLRSLRLLVRLKDQRSKQTQWLRQNLQDPETQLHLQRLLLDPPLERPTEDGLLGREVLLALHSWLLDHPSDGRRQGVPFDPHLLYLHRRIVKVRDALTRLLDHPGFRERAFRPLINFHQNLCNYLQDPEVLRAAELFEAASLLFERLREILRLQPNHSTPLSDSYSLEASGNKQIQQALLEYRKELETQARDHPDPEIQKLHQIVLDHLDRYKNSLFREHHANEKPRERTTNGLEGHWRERKRKRREAHGRSKLTLDFQALPEEYMLVSNLDNPVYLSLVLGENQSLPEALARAAENAGPFNHWLRTTRPKLIGRLPTKLIRQEGFINQLLSTYDQHALVHLEEPSLAG